MNFKAAKKIFREAAERGSFVIVHLRSVGTIHIHFDENAILIACDRNAQVFQVRDYGDTFISVESIEYIEVYPSTQTNKQ